MFCTDKRKGDDHGFMSLFKASQGLLRCNLQAEELAGRNRFHLLILGVHGYVRLKTRSTSPLPLRLLLSYMAAWFLLMTQASKPGGATRGVLTWIHDCATWLFAWMW